MDAAIDDGNESGAAHFVGVDAMGGCENPSRVHQCRPTDMLPAASLTKTANVRKSPYRRIYALVSPGPKYSVLEINAEKITANLSPMSQQKHQL